MRRSAFWFWGSRIGAGVAVYCTIFAVGSWFADNGYWRAYAATGVAGVLAWRFGNRLGVRTAAAERAPAANPDVAQCRWEVGQCIDTFGAEDARTLGAQLVLADACWASGQQDEALYWYMATHASCLRALGSDHPMSIKAEHQLRAAHRRSTSGLDENDSAGPSDSP
ncbi:tetratricopeptide repeat protein [Nocardia sp. NBC_00565]|uniref:tetratricopeptide repeat protein n=1 Tax=Nocardia sp. NBC_00565 TaxID=2975993 RepID=UPI002E81B5A0|nr:tetratricopeptide repeat protein [Nocardia sp. NBC_00565]WUC06385.1 tetratricopeptide repeat protein [Nocardia sp. NBC_00565]